VLEWSLEAQTDVKLAASQDPAGVKEFYSSPVRTEQGLLKGRREAQVERNHRSLSAVAPSCNRNQKRPISIARSKLTRRRLIAAL
jgi:hypothetical protein